MNIPVAPLSNSAATEWVVPEWMDQRRAAILVDRSRVCEGVDFQGVIAWGIGFLHGVRGWWRAG